MGASTGKGRRGGRISRSGDFDRVYKQGRSRGGRCFVAYAFERPEEGGDSARLGITVGRKVGSAVKRNSVKRCVREAFASISDSVPGDLDIVIVARAGAAELVEQEGMEGVRREISELITALEEGRDGSKGAKRKT